MIPTLNVNLRCVPHEEGKIGGGVPVLIPCPPPRTVEMTVRLGECNDMPSCGLREHHTHCPARPIRVTCTIGGDTWEESEVTGIAPMDGPSGDPVGLLLRCRERWAQIKALATGKAWTSVEGFTALPRNLFEQRDAKFAALTKLVLAEQAAIVAQAECDAAFPIDTYVKVPAPDHRAEPHPSAVRLAAFVSHLIATVGALT